MRVALRGWSLYALAWVPPALLYALAVTAQGEATFAQGLITGVVLMTVAAFQGVIVWRLTERLPLQRSPFLFYPLHLALAGTYGLLLVGAQTGWLWLVAGRAVALEVVRMGGPWQVVSGGWMYAMIAGVSYLIRTQRRLREQEVAHARAQAAAAQLQLRALRAQLNPHFLFNSLHSLGALVRQDAAAAEDAIERLGELLRYALDHGAQESVPLAEEVAFVRNYLELEKLRFADRLRVRYDVDAGCEYALVPPFLLQPLVENAVRHGIAPRPAGGSLQIRARERDGQLLIDVRDDGQGAAPSDVNGASGLGLRVLRELLERRYGTHASFHVETTKEQGFLVSLALPLRAIRVKETVS